VSVSHVATAVAAPVFYLGVDHPNWLWSGGMDCPLFVSYGTLRERKTKFPRAVVPGWAMDSRGFRELQEHGRWTISPRDYVEMTIRCDREIGALDWAAPQDHMCEREIIEGGVYGRQVYAGTRQFLDPGHTLTYEDLVIEHQRRTVANYLELTALWGEYRRRGDTVRDSPYRCVLQGKPGDVASYLRCAQMYEDAGVRLGDCELTGVGSVCKLQSEPAIGRLARGLGPLGLRLHWFGLKLTGLPYVYPHVRSHDSMAWSLHFRRSPRMPGCTHVFTRGPRKGQPSSCTHCPPAARAWQRDVAALGVSLHRAARWQQGDLFTDAAGAA
jgi:hypothetical protein